MAESKSQRFYKWVSDLTKLAQQHYRARNIPSLLNVMKRFRTLFNDNQKDPELAWLETATTNCLLMLAEAYLDELEFDDCIELCEETKALLETKNTRVEVLKGRSSPYGMAWLRLIYLLADTKWKCPEEYRDAVIEPEKMIEICLAARSSVISDLHANPRPASIEATIRAGIGLALIKTACMSLRYVKDETQDILSLLVRDVGDIGFSVDSKFYWYMKIAELLQQNDCTARDFAEAYTRLRRAIISEGTAHRNLTALEKALSNEENYLKARILPNTLIDFTKNTSH